MSGRYTREEMIEWLKNYFQKEKDFPVKDIVDYPDDLGPVRVPLHCLKKENEKIIDESVVDFTIYDTVLKSQFFPEIEIESIAIQEAAPVTFYQYYFPKARIYFAYPDYIKKDSEFDGIVRICKKRGIGLLEVSRETGVMEKALSHTLVTQFLNAINNSETTRKSFNEIIGDYLENYIIYLVYYPDPDYKRRAIIRRKTNDAKDLISFSLIDKLSELTNICYKDDLIELSLKYRQKSGNDWEIAEKVVKDLWEKYLDLEYPNVQRRIENILQKDERYREHFVHQFQVFLIGAYILDKLYPEIGSQYQEKYKSNIENVWLAASTFHDFNYGLQNFDAWLLQYFKETLRISSIQTKENLNIFNLDSAMIRETLYDKLLKIITQFNCTLDKDDEEKLIKYFYEKTVRDRNHGVLSAISILKLFEDKTKEHENNTEYSLWGEEGILQAALAICIHDEDIWESLCGCLGYRRSPSKLPDNEDDCIKKCGRDLWTDKKSRIYKEKISDGISSEKIKDYKCESWERFLMKKRIIKEISFEEYPIVFLLILCDTVQDEGRIISSYEGLTNDRSSLDNIVFKDSAKSTSISIKLISEKQQEKEDEVERVSWCLKDERFEICINNECKILSGKR